MSEANESNLNKDAIEAELSIEEIAKISGGVARAPRTRNRGIEEAEGGMHGLEHRGKPDSKFFRPAFPKE